jgi:hypothetical protein
MVLALQAAATAAIDRAKAEFTEEKSRGEGAAGDFSSSFHFHSALSLGGEILIKHTARHVLHFTCCYSFRSVFSLSGPNRVCAHRGENFWCLTEIRSRSPRAISLASGESNFIRRHRVLADY